MFIRVLLTGGGHYLLPIDDFDQDPIRSRDIQNQVKQDAIKACNAWITQEIPDLRQNVEEESNTQYMTQEEFDALIESRVAEALMAKEAQKESGSSHNVTASHNDSSTAHKATDQVDSQLTQTLPGPPGLDQNHAPGATGYVDQNHAPPKSQ